MKRLYSRLEEIRYLHVVVAVLEIWVILVCSYVYGINKVFLENVEYSLAAFCVLEAIVFCIWYPKEHMRKIAIARGKEYKGKIVSIYTKEKKVHGPYSSKIAYRIKVCYHIDRKAYFAEFGDYGRCPFEYVNAQEMCSVYIYKGKVYPQYFYKKQKENIEKDEEREKLLWKVTSGKLDNTPLDKLLKYSIKDIAYLTRDELQHAISERMDFCMVDSKSYMIFDPFYFSYIDKPFELNTVFVEVHMTSRKKYNSCDLGLKLLEYCQYVHNRFSYYEEDVVCKGIRKIVVDGIRELDKRIVVNEVCIVIRSGH